VIRPALARHTAEKAGVVQPQPSQRTREPGSASNNVQELKEAAQRLQALRKSSVALAATSVSGSDASQDAASSASSSSHGQQRAGPSPDDWLSKLKARNEAAMARVWNMLPLDDTLSETVLPMKTGKPSDIRPDDRVFPEQVDPDDPEYCIGTFEDIGAQQQAAWCDLAVEYHFRSLLMHEAVFLVLFRQQQKAHQLEGHLFVVGVL
jgi:hypothetical protein